MSDAAQPQDAQSVREDIAFMRTLAQDGASGPLFGGSILLAGGLIYASAISVFGGTAQFAVAWLTDLTGSPLAPAWYLTGAVAITLVAMSQMPESAPRKLTRKNTTRMAA